MALRWGTLAVAAVVALLLSARAVHSSADVRVAVVEYAPSRPYVSPVGPDGRPLTRAAALVAMLAVASDYAALAALAASSGASLVVFPEYGLTGPDFPSRASAAPFLDSVPDPGAAIGSIPCADPRPEGIEVLRALSCAARDANVTLVAVLGTAQPCSRGEDGCPTDGQFQFNTQAAFGSDGSLLALYHKVHLFFEAAFDPGRRLGVVFDAPFGARVGLLVCYDAVFADSVDALVAHDADIVAMSSWWVNVPPFLVAAQFQQALSAAYSLRVVAANTGYAARNAGSGIFVSGDALAYTALGGSFPRAKTLSAVLHNLPVHAIDVRPPPPEIVAKPLPLPGLASQWNSNGSYVPVRLPAKGSACWEHSFGSTQCQLCAEVRDASASSSAPLGLGAYEGVYIDLQRVSVCAAFALDAKGRPSADVTAAVSLRKFSVFAQFNSVAPHRLFPLYTGASATLLPSVSVVANRTSVFFDENATADGCVMVGVMATFQ